jgi:hypothetical protein
MFYEAHTLNLDTNTWSKTPFEKRKDALKFVRDHVKYPGEYNLKYTQGVWNEQACIFQDNERKTGTGHYPNFVHGSADFRNHWQLEEEKCLFEGFLIYEKPSEGLQFVVPCLYYWYLNYCPIPDKVKQRDDFPEIYDGDLHYYLYILECILVREYGVVLKKRQSGYTLKNMSIKLNAIWFGRKAMSKIFAFDENKVKESWAFMTQYRDHNNRYCAWTRNFDPGKPLDWHMRRKQKDGSYRGRDCQAKGFTTKQNPSNGIGGSAKVIFGEESGANPTLDKTHEFITSNVAYGGLVTGLIIYSGAVGELDQAEPLKEFILHPTKHQFVPRPNNIEDDLEFGPEVGFFAPEWWNYMSVERDENDKPIGEALRCFDEWGNSNKELALKEIAMWRDKAKNKEPEKYRYYCSQRPLSIKEAFAFRKSMIFPANLVLNQEQRIERGDYACEYVDIVPNLNNELEIVKSNKQPVREFPIKESSKEKEGIIEMWERPFCYPARPELGKYYYASIDPVATGETVSSDSLFSIIIHKLDVEVTKHGENGAETHIEPGKIVCEWTGRFDDLNETNTRAERIVELYGAWTLCENNFTSFITHMMNRKKQYYLIPKKEILFLKELNANENVFQDYGWKNTGTLFSKNMLDYGVSYCKEVIDQQVESDGKIVKNIHGIERIPSLMIIREMKAYFLGLNVDRLIAFCAMACLLKVQLANKGYLKRIEYDKAPEANPDLYAKPRNFFTQRNMPNSKYVVMRNPFKNLK